MKEIELEQKIEVCNYIINHLKMDRLKNDKLNHLSFGLCQIVHNILLRDIDYKRSWYSFDYGFDEFIYIKFPEFQIKLENQKRILKKQIYVWRMIPYDYDSRINFMQELKQELENKLKQK